MVLGLAQVDTAVCGKDRYAAHTKTQAWQVCASTGTVHGSKNGAKMLTTF